MEKQIDWWKRAVVYQIYPRSFQDRNDDGIGDIQGIISRLDYLEFLGIDVIWLCPMYDSPNDDNGYDISDYYSVMKDFGTIEDMLILFEEVHKRDMKVIMDLVVNHTSDEHAWFQQAKLSKNNPYHEYYIWRDKIDNHEPNPWMSNFGGSAWAWNEATNSYYLHLFSKKQPDLNWDYKPLRDDVYAMMRWWLDKGIDGFRMDVISYISKDANALIDATQPTKTTAANGPHVHEYLQEMNREVLAHYDIMCVGENPDASIEEAKQYAGFHTNELQMIFQFELMDVDGGESSRWHPLPIELTKMKTIMGSWQKGLDGIAWNSLFWNNHDQPRVVSRFGDDSTPFYRDKSAKMLATMLYMMQGTPYIYQGEEIGMTNCSFDSIEQYDDIDSLQAYHQEISLGRDAQEMLKVIQYRSRDNARTPMQWDTTEHAGFSHVKPWLQINPAYVNINVEEALQNQDSIFHYYRKLIQLRHHNDCAIYGSYEDIAIAHPALYIYRRNYQNESLLIICNFTKDRQMLDKTILEGFGDILLHNYDDIEEGSLRAYEAIVYHSIS